MPRVERHSLPLNEFPNPPKRTDVIIQIERILSSPDFLATERIRRFLSYVVHEAIDGRKQRLKGYTIAVEVLGRSPDFDLQNDPVVRIEAGRLRRSLERYYLKAGRADCVLIDIPKGTYAPEFSWIQAPFDALPSPPSATPVDAGREQRTRPWFGTALALAIASMGLAFSLWLARPQQNALPARASGDRPALIVSPFSNLSGDAETSWLAAGMTEEIISQLAETPRFIVFKRGSAPIKPPGAADPARMFILEGSVRISRGVLRVNGRVLDPASGEVLWSQSYDGDLRNTDTLCAEATIAMKITSAITRAGGAFLRGLDAPTVPATGAREQRAACL